MALSFENAQVEFRTSFALSHLIKLYGESLEKWTNIYDTLYDAKLRFLTCYFARVTTKPYNSSYLPAIHIVGSDFYLQKFLAINALQSLGVRSKNRSQITRTKIRLNLYRIFKIDILQLQNAFLKNTDESQMKTFQTTWNTNCQ